MSADQILVVTDVISDAEMIVRMLGEEDYSAEISTEVSNAARDFEKYQPSLLILAFNDLLKAHDYYFGLLRSSRKVHSIRHRTLVLCHKSELRQTYLLCKKEVFDSYVLFWPLTHDATRLYMEVHHAMRAVDSQEVCQPAKNQLSTKVRDLTGLAPLVEQVVAESENYIETANESLRRVEEELIDAFEGISQQLEDTNNSNLDKIWLQSVLNQLIEQNVETPLGRVITCGESSQQKLKMLGNELTPKLESMYQLRKMVDKVRPVVMLVDDDELQHELLRWVLLHENIELRSARSGIQALIKLRSCSPDLILMDVDMPDEDGVETMRRIRDIEEFADLPIIMLTGHNNKDVVYSSLAAGAMGFIVKPFTKKVLITKLKRFLKYEPVGKFTSTLTVEPCNDSATAVSD